MTEHVADTRGAGSPEPHVSRAWDTPLLLGVTAACGGTFVATKDAVLAYSAAGFLAGRFGLAVLALAPPARASAWSWRSPTPCKPSACVARSRRTPASSPASSW